MVHDIPDLILLSKTPPLNFMLTIIYCSIHADIDECARGLAGCSYNCINTAGSYYCTCMDGFELLSDNHTCAGDA